jgi:hypothetical protein
VAQFSNFAALWNLGVGGGGSGDLATVLGTGNTTGGSDIEFSSGDAIVTTANGFGAGFDLNITGGDAGGGSFDGGDLVLSGGAGAGGNPDGEVRVDGDLTVTGTLSMSNLLTGVGTPEGAAAAPPSTLFQRTDGDSSTNANLYVKMLGVGTTGWAPLVPPVFEIFVAVGVATFVTSRDVFPDSAALGIENIAVFWNGVMQRRGGYPANPGADDYSVTFGLGSATITFTSTPPPGDFVTIRYLPA